MTGFALFMGGVSNPLLHQIFNLACQDLSIIRGAGKAFFFGMELARRALPQNAVVIPTGVPAFITIQGNEFCPGQSGGISSTVA